MPQGYRTIEMPEMQGFCEAWASKTGPFQRPRPRKSLQNQDFVVR
jgi:hypothetical protein